MNDLGFVVVVVCDMKQNKMHFELVRKKEIFIWI